MLEVDYHMEICLYIYKDEQSRISNHVKKNLSPYIQSGGGGGSFELEKTQVHRNCVRYDIWYIVRRVEGLITFSRGYIVRYVYRVLLVVGWHLACSLVLTITTF